MIRHSLIAAALILTFACDENAKEEKSRSQESKVNDEDSQEPPPEGRYAGLTLRFTWDAHSDSSLISYRVSRLDGEAATLVKEWAIEDVSSENQKYHVDLPVMESLADDFADQQVCFVLSAVSDGGASSPTDEACVDLSGFELR